MADPTPSVPAPPSLAKKLGIKPGYQVLLVEAPPGFVEQLGPLPPGARFLYRQDAAFALDLIVLFVTLQVELRGTCAALAARLAPAGMLWVAWPKRASGRPTDLTFAAVQSAGLAAGLVDTKIAAIDANLVGPAFCHSPPRSTEERYLI